MTKIFICRLTGQTKVHCRIERGERQREVHDYGVTDSKGRKVGGILMTWVETYVDDETSSYIIDPNLVGKSRFVVELHSSRDGKVFGAIPRATYHMEAADANKHANKAIAAARRRALKVHG